MSSRTNRMITADAKVELASGLRCNLDGAIGGTYRLPDGREFWIDGATVSEVLSRIEPVILSWIEAHGTALEASPNSRTEAITDEMIEAGVAAFNHTETLSVRRLLEVAYPAMRAAELQDARPIDQQDD